MLLKDDSQLKSIYCDYYLVVYSNIHVSAPNFIFLQLLCLKTSSREYIFDYFSIFNYINNNKQIYVQNHSKSNFYEF